MRSEDGKFGYETEIEIFFKDEKLWRENVVKVFWNDAKASEVFTNNAERFSNLSRDFPKRGNPVKSWRWQ